MFTPLPIIIATILLRNGVLFLWRIRSGRPMTRRETKQVTDLILVLVFPLLLAISLGVYLGSWIVAAGFLVLSVGILAGLIMLQPYGFNLHLVKGYLQLAGTSFARSQEQLIVLFPVLLLVVLFSVFSRGFWQAVGTLPFPNVLVASLFIIIPAFILAARSRVTVTNEIVVGIPACDTVFKTAGEEPFIKAQLERSLISIDEWREAQNQFRQNPKNKLEEFILPILRKRVNRHLNFLLIFNGLLLFVAFLVFFIVLNSILIAPTALNSWIGDQYESILIPLKGVSGIGSYSLAVPIIQGSILLAIFVTTIATVNSLTRADVKAIFTKWLRERADVWTAICSIYRSISSPN